MPTLKLEVLPDDVRGQVTQWLWACTPNRLALRDVDATCRHGDGTRVELTELTRQVGDATGDLPLAARVVRLHVGEVNRELLPALVLAALQAWKETYKE